ncbi:MetQ/NlpA family ABC transporter substrate-binding protein [Herbiconiux flava]|uniref:D-methionine transport system substrate-binding protein n=1 Tax=Herbiconiux flava TaxID=881268 RepID=A0A852SMR7_9MICO|nr:MetQ/NlpA family ABC transporter substrate-binding protein [Herbiconiux flava]NYD70107.1 D-methionine transport system substrate-binding protein [Herbiconiux flava]GLK16859.1 ABC transporter substrate-binding protein [Herbiconiux flava]
MPITARTSTAPASSTRKLAAAAATLPLLLGLASCAGSSDAAGGSSDPVRIGVVGASDPYWETYEEAAADAGIPVEIVDFSDYAQPNPALSEGELDLNQFQHIVYLAQYNVAADEDLVPIGSTAIYPLGLYSTKYDSVDAIQQGDTVAVPNDESNLARGLLVLQSAGLVELKDGGSIFSTLDDVDESASKVKVTTLDAALTATSLPDVAAAIINNDFIQDAGLTAADAIAEDDPSDPNALPYVNIFAARAEDKDDPTYAKLVELFQDTTSVTDGLVENSGGTAELLKTPVSELEASLTEVEADTKAHEG